MANVNLKAKYPVMDCEAAAEKFTGIEDKWLKLSVKEYDRNEELMADDQTTQFTGLINCYCKE